jgi:dTMP kinase
VPRPDLTILLDVPHDLARRLVDAKGHRDYLGGAGRDAHEADTDHQRCAAAAYRELAEREPNWARVDCFQDGRLLAPAEIAEEIWKHVKPQL